MSSSLQPHGLWPARLFCPWDSLGKRILEWVAMPSYRGSSQPRDRTQVSCVAGRFFTTEPYQNAYHWESEWLESVGVHCEVTCGRETETEELTCRNMDAKQVLRRKKEAVEWCNNSIIPLCSCHAVLLYWIWSLVVVCQVLKLKVPLKVKVKVKSLSRVRLFATPWTVTY